MPRTHRRDEPGDWFHVMNRAIARRTLFENRSDIHRFIDGMSTVAANGWLEFHSYSVLHTHFHALVRSPQGELSRALHLLQLDYVRHFNRSRRRDGPLMRGRFRSMHVTSERYRRAVVGYIDDNPVSARLVSRPEDHEFGSCRAFVHGSGPAWLCRDWIDAQLAPADRHRSFGSRYLETFGKLSRMQLRLVDRRIASQATGPDPIDALIEGSERAVRDWMRAKSHLADRSHPGLALVPQEAVMQTMTRPPEGTSPDLVTAASLLLLRDLAALTFDRIAEQLRTSPEWARRRCHRARTLLAEDEPFARFTAAAAHAALVATYGEFRADQFRPDSTGTSMLATVR